jgi:two-component system, NtrC family, sensor kinase
MGITLRTALLSWLVTSVTLLIFVGVIIPQQKRMFLEHLESKAHGVAVSLRDVAAGAAVNDDSGSVVAHCTEMLKGDRALAYLVVTRNDGASLIHQLNPAHTNETVLWSMETLGKEWRPDKREATSGIDVVPLFQRRVFHYSQPFDYSGIQWGWIHVGLSLESYDRSVVQVYHRTGVLAVVCLLLSLLASVLYAKHLVQPILSLRQVVRKVASGDLAARAVIDRGDELGNLADSVNSMTEALLRRDQILQSVRFAAQQFLSTANWETVVNGVLSKIGDAASVSRIQILQGQPDEGGIARSKRLFEWESSTCPGIEGTAKQSSFTVPGPVFDVLVPLIAQGQIVARRTSELPAAAREMFEARHVKSFIALPIKLENSWWGILTLADCLQERQWTDSEHDSFRAAADMLGAAIARQRTQDALIEAKATLEDRVRERTSQLQEQMAAKEKAHTELAEAQQRLMDMSRLAGMAEVASGVLHNVGNVLNSVSVSATLVASRLKQSKLANLGRATAMLREQNGNLAHFLTADPKGRILPEYLSSVAEQLATEQSGMLTEVALLGQNIEHIKEIVAMQQSYAKVSGAFEHLNPTELVEDALRMNAAAFERHGVELVRHYDAHLPLVNVDRHKVLQILINLIRNAKYALNAARPENKQLEVRLQATSVAVAIRIKDNGVGISPENLTRIFRHGFTTKKDGHGFGLHSGANAAKEMGGRLSARSEGLGQGAEFTLELPIAPQENSVSK